MAISFLTNELGVGSLLIMEAAFGANLSAASATWTWTDITTDLYNAPGFSCRAGRNEEASNSSPAQANFKLKNTSGNYSKGPQSAYWPYVRKNVPVRLRINPNDGSGYRVVFFGYVDTWAPDWDSAKGDIPVVEVSASGYLRRLVQNDSPVLSPYTRSLTTNTTVMAYWPLEDKGSNTSTSASAKGGADATITGSPSFGTDTSFVASKALPVIKDGRMEFVLNPYTSTGKNQIRFLCRFPPLNSLLIDGTVLGYIWTTGSLMRWDITYEVSGGIPGVQLFCYNSDNTLNFSSSILLMNTGLPDYDYDLPIRLSLELTQNGANVDWKFSYWKLKEPNAWYYSGSVLTKTVGIVSKVIVGPVGAVGEMTFGHLSIQNDVTSTFESLGAVNAYNGESPSSRFSNLCTDNGISLTYTGSGSTHNGDLMGYQSVDTVLNLLREVETNDQGILWDGKTQGIIYRTRRWIETKNTAITVNAATKQLYPDLSMVDSDTHLVNKFTAQNKYGSSATYEDTLSNLSTPQIGTFDSSGTVNFYLNSQLYPYAGFMVARGTLDDYRFPEIRVNLRATPSLAPSVLDCYIGDVIAVQNLSTILNWAPEGTLYLVIEGYQHEISQKSWIVTFKCSPFALYDTGEAYSPTGDTNTKGLRADTTGSTTTTAIAAATTSVTVATTDTTKPLWTTASDDYPLSLDINGYQVTASACSGTTSPQTFTITATGKTIPIGARVKLWQQKVIGL